MEYYVNLSLTILIFAGIAFAVYWYQTHCPNCKRIFTRERIKKEKVGGAVKHLFTGKEKHHLRCKRCQHTWHKNWEP